MPPDPSPTEVAAIQKYAPEFQPAMPTTAPPTTPAVAPQPAAQSAPKPAPVSAAPTSQSPTSAPNVPAGLDPEAYTLTKAIAYQENGGATPSYTIASGDDGSTPDGSTGNIGGGAYQFTAPTWAAWAGQVLGDPNAPMTPENQNQVAYTKIKSWLDAGYTPAQAASMWNAGEGAPNAYFDTNQAHGDTPKYVSNVQQYAEQLWSGQTPAQPAPPPSALGFAENTVKSAANFAGNLGEAVLHPVQTVENIGGAAVGGLQELGGQQNANTASFNNIVEYFKQRYGSVDDFLNTAYTDPVGIAADVATALGVGAGAAGIAGKAAELSTVADAARAGELFDASGLRTMVGDAASGNTLTRGLSATQSALSKGSELANPLTPIVSGVGKLVGDGGGIASEVGSQLTGMEPKTIDDIIAHPEEFTPEQVANTTRASVAQQVQGGLKQQAAQFDEAGAAYAPIRESGTQITVAKNFLEDQFRKEAKVDVVDGEVVSQGSSKVRAPKDVAALQSLFDTWKPEFQKGSLTAEEFLNFRQDLAAAAKYDREFSASKPVESVAAGIRSNFNNAYRSQIDGLAAKDADFSAKLQTNERLSKGFIDKDGNLLSTAINKVANAVGKGKDQDLARLEEIVPGITRKLQVLKSIEDIQKAGGGTKVGTYPSAFLKAGGVIGGLATGNMGLVATALATTIIASPDVAVPLLRVFGMNKGLVSGVLAHLAKYATLSATINRAAGGTPDTQAQTPPASPQATDVSSLPDTTTPDANAPASGG